MLKNKIQINSTISGKNKKITNKLLKKHIWAFSIAGLVLVIIIFAIVFLINSVILPRDKYLKAMNLISNKQYSGACQILADLGNYKDSREQLKIYSQNLIKSAKIGDVIYWGEYEQDNVISDGKDAITWKVLDIKTSKLLLLSDKILDVKPYNEKKELVTWETCTLREWLNGEFLNIAFSPSEQAIIYMSELQNNGNDTYKTDGGNNTKDKIFLLSIDEAKNYFSNDKQRVADETRYAKKQGVNSKFYMKGWWFLRSPGFDSTMVSIIGGKGVARVDGAICDDGVPVFHSDAIRPAMWIDLSSF